MVLMKFYDLFSGIGGFHLGLQGLGFECVGACEIDKYAAQVYQRHFKINPLGNALTMDASRIPDFDVLCAGFPCQPFSYAGLQKGFADEKNGNLFQEGIVRIAKAKQPKYLFLENVKGLLSNDRGRTFAKILYTLDEIGYNVEWQCINAKHFVPQSRERVFIIGHLRTKSTQPIFSIRESSTGHNQQMPKEQRRKQELVTASCIDAHYELGTGGSRTLLVMLTERRTAHAKEIRRKMQKEHGKDWCSRRDKELVPRDDNIANCITATQGREHLLLNPQTSKVRKLTPLECERLMGFPDGWTDVGIPEARRYRCLGNAVVPKVITYIGKKLI